MYFSIEILILFILLSDLLLLASSRILLCIRTLALQGILLSLLPFLIEKEDLELHRLLLGLLALILRGIVFPLMIKRTVLKVGVKREVEPFIGFTASLFLGVLAFVGCFILDDKLALPISADHRFLLPVAFFTIFTGLFLIITRKKALTQVIGYLVLENGISTFGISTLAKDPWFLEVGILLDLLVGVFIMGIIVFHINNEFDHIDSHQLSMLGDWKKGSITNYLNAEREDK